MKFTVRVPTFEEEKRRVGGLRSRLDWYRSHGYDILLPTNDLEEEFRLEDYQKAVEQVGSRREVVLQAADRIKEFSEMWHVVVPQAVTVVITKYGVGGSYDVDSARIVLLLKPDGTFMKPVEHLVVHELLHLASDRSLVELFGLTHGQKERFVDLLCRDAFGDLLPGYRLQPMGDSTIDSFLVGLPNLDLRVTLEKFDLSTPLGGADRS